VAERDPLPAGEAHLWSIDLASSAALFLSERALSLMTDAERGRHDRYRFERNRLEYRVTRALCRTILGRYLGRAPASLEFSLGERGKPALIPLPGEEPLAFNLSNTDGLVACLVARHHEVGVDIEPLDRRVDCRGVAHRYFSTSETAALFALPESAQARRFLDLWTLKEAYIKACGGGLAIPLDHFSFRPEQRPISICFAPEREDNPAHWQFASFELAPHHLGAIAIRHGEANDLRLVFRDLLPEPGS
jgi:4'-phosphopantetheinyl transferase